MNVKQSSTFKPNPKEKYPVLGYQRDSFASQWASLHAKYFFGRTGLDEHLRFGRFGLQNI